MVDDMREELLGGLEDRAADSRVRHAIRPIRLKCLRERFCSISVVIFFKYLFWVSSESLLYGALLLYRLR